MNPTSGLSNNWKLFDTLIDDFRKHDIPYVTIVERVRTRMSLPSEDQTSEQQVITHSFRLDFLESRLGTPQSGPKDPKILLWRFPLEGKLILAGYSSEDKRAHSCPLVGFQYDKHKCTNKEFDLLSAHVEELKKAQHEHEYEQRTITCKLNFLALEKRFQPYAPHGVDTLGTVTFKAKLGDKIVHIVGPYTMGVQTYEVFYSHNPVSDSEMAALKTFVADLEYESILSKESKEREVKGSFSKDFISKNFKELPRRKGRFWWECLVGDRTAYITCPVVQERGWENVTFTFRYAGDITCPPFVEEYQKLEAFVSELRVKYKSEEESRVLEVRAEFKPSFIDRRFQEAGFENLKPRYQGEVDGRPIVILLVPDRSGIPSKLVYSFKYLSVPVTVGAFQKLKAFVQALQDEAQEPESKQSDVIDFFSVTSEFTLEYLKLCYGNPQISNAEKAFFSGDLKGWKIIISGPNKEGLHPYHFEYKLKEVTESMQVGLRSYVVDLGLEFVKVQKEWRAKEAAQLEHALKTFTGDFTWEFLSKKLGNPNVIAGKSVCFGGIIKGRHFSVTGPFLPGLQKYTFSYSDENAPLTALKDLEVFVRDLQTAYLEVINPPPEEPSLEIVELFEYGFIESFFQKNADPETRSDQEQWWTILNGQMVKVICQSADPKTYDSEHFAFSYAVPTTIPGSSQRLREFVSKLRSGEGQWRGANRYFFGSFSAQFLERTFGKPVAFEKDIIFQATLNECQVTITGRSEQAVQPFRVQYSPIHIGITKKHIQDLSDFVNKLQDQEDGIEVVGDRMIVAQFDRGFITKRFGSPVKENTWIYDGPQAVYTITTSSDLQSRSVAFASEKTDFSNYDLIDLKVFVRHLLQEFRNLPKPAVPEDKTTVKIPRVIYGSEVTEIPVTSEFLSSYYGKPEVINERSYWHNPQGFPEGITIEAPVPKSDEYSRPVYVILSSSEKETCAEDLREAQIEIAHNYGVWRSGDSEGEEDQEPSPEIVRVTAVEEEPVTKPNLETVEQRLPIGLFNSFVVSAYGPGEFDLFHGRVIWKNPGGRKNIYLVARGVAPFPADCVMRDYDVVCTDPDKTSIIDAALSIRKDFDKYMSTKK